MYEKEKTNSLVELHTSGMIFALEGPVGTQLFHFEIRNVVITAPGSSWGVFRATTLASHPQIHPRARNDSRWLSFPAAPVWLRWGKFVELLRKSWNFLSLRNSIRIFGNTLMKFLLHTGIILRNCSSMNEGDPRIKSDNLRIFYFCFKTLSYYFFFFLLCGSWPLHNHSNTRCFFTR